MLAGSSRSTRSRSHGKNTREQSELSDKENREINMAQPMDIDKSREYYDPEQDKEERRGIRQKYRKMIKNTEENRLDLINADIAFSTDQIHQANAIYTKVKNPQEALLDSRFLALSADIGVQRARNLKLDSHHFNGDEYITKLITFMGGRRPDRDHDEPLDLDWARTGSLASRFWKKAPAMGFMLGPLSVEQKARKARVARQERKSKDAVVRPQMLKEEDIVREENETSNNVKEVYKTLHETGKQNLLQFIINPESFSQTVENMFYLSFLVRDGKVSIEEENGEYIVDCAEAASTEEYADGLEKKQFIMDIDMKTWLEMIELYDIQKSVIRTRVSRTATENGKWFG